jgi:hypothetical protein
LGSWECSFPLEDTAKEVRMQDPPVETRTAVGWKGSAALDVGKNLIQIAACHFRKSPVVLSQAHLL